MRPLWAPVAALERQFCYKINHQRVSRNLTGSSLSQPQLGLSEMLCREDLLGNLVLILFVWPGSDCFVVGIADLVLNLEVRVALPLSRGCLSKLGCVGCI